MWRTAVMESSGGPWTRACLLIVAVQVLVGVESATIAVPSRERWLNSGSSYLRFPNRSPYRGASRRPPKLYEEQASVLIGSDVEMPYRLYKQVVDSFKASEQILCLLPNNQIQTVNGYAELKDAVKEYGSDTKVIITQDIMIPADIYLRAVVIDPNEIMVRLSDGEVIPNLLFEERLGTNKKKATVIAGQTYYPDVPPAEFDPYLIDGSTSAPSKTKDAPPGAPGFNPRPEIAGIDEEVPPCPITSVPADPLPTPPTTTVPQCDTPLPLPQPVTPHLPTPPCEASFQSPYPNFFASPSPTELQPPAIAPLDLEKLFDSMRSTPWNTHSTPFTPPSLYPHTVPGIVTSHPGTRCALGEHKTYLPSGVHFVDAARCHVCDSASHAPHFTAFSV